MFVEHQVVQDIKLFQVGDWMVVRRGSGRLRREVRGLSSWRPSKALEEAGGSGSHLSSKLLSEVRAKVSLCPFYR
jgi:hypothetical protein